MDAIPYYGMRSPQRIGRALRDARQRRGMAQADVAIAAGISREAVARLESGKQGTRAETLVSVLRALGMELVFWPRSMPIPEPSERDRHG